MFRYSNHDEVLNFAINQLKTYLPQAGDICPNGSDTIQIRIRESLETIGRLGDSRQREEIKTYVINTMNARREKIDLSDFIVSNSFNKISESVRSFTNV